MRLNTLLIAALFLSPTAHAMVFGVSPANLVFNNATRGRHYTMYLTASTTEDVMYCSVSAAGAVAPWLRFGNDTFVITKSQYVLPVRLTVPESIPNGDYEGIISVQAAPKPAGTGATGMTVGAVIYVRTSVHVGGAEGAWFRVLRLSIPNAKEGEPVSAELVLKNDADVAVYPLMTFGIVAHDRATRHSSKTVADEMVDAMGRKSVEANLSTQGLPPGLYFMHIEIAVEDKVYWDSMEPFYVTSQSNPLGEMLDINGILEDASVSSTNISLGEPFEVTASFTNAGGVPIDARFKIEVIMSGRVVYANESSPAYVEVGETRKNTVRYQPAEPGEYRVRVWVEYFGGRTEVREASVIVWKYTTPMFGLDVNFYTVGIPAVVLIIIWLFAYYRKYYVREE